MSCTPTGKARSAGESPSPGQTGTVHTGRPMQEIGCVSTPSPALVGMLRPLISNVSWPTRGATAGAAAAINRSKRSNNAIASE